MNSNWSYSLEPSNLGKIRQFFLECDLAIWRMTLKNNRAPLICYFKLRALFRSHWWVKTGDTVRKCPIWVKINDSVSHVTLQFDVWPRKTIGHLVYTTSSFVHHFVAISEFKLELQSGKAQFGSKSTIVHHFVSIGDFKLELQSGYGQSGSNLTIFAAVWPRSLTDDLEKPF